MDWLLLLTTYCGLIQQRPILSSRIFPIDRSLFEVLFQLGQEEN
jgi:hypothetical protein